MVEQVQAFRTFDGKVFDTREAAGEHEVRTRLRQLAIFNEATINAVLQHASALREILKDAVPLLTADKPVDEERYPARSIEDADFAAVVEDSNAKHG